MKHARACRGWLRLTWQIAYGKVVEENCYGGLHVARAVRPATTVLWPLLNPRCISLHICKQTSIMEQGRGKSNYTHNSICTGEMNCGMCGGQLTVWPGLVSFSPDLFADFTSSPIVHSSLHTITVCSILLHTVQVWLHSKMSQFLWGRNFTMECKLGNLSARLCV